MQLLNYQLQSELELAREIQQNLLPAPVPNFPAVDVRCYSEPAKVVSGDFYQYHLFALPSKTTEQKYAFAIGDVSGKGASAALLMAASLSQLDASFTLPLSSTARMQHLDKAITSYTKPQKQNCALCYVELEVLPAGSTSPFKLSMVNAGCIPPYIKRRDGTVEQPDIGGFALGQGLGAQVGYQAETLALWPGDMVVLTSDGVVEANNSAGDMLGFERLAEILQRSVPVKLASQLRVGQSEAELLLNYLLHEIKAFTGSAEYRDDLTIMVLQV